MKRTLRLGAIVVIGGCLFAGALALMQGQRIRLQSEDSRFAERHIRTGSGVRIVQRLSDAPCRLGYSWGYDANHIWVDHGCRAIFEVNAGRWDDWNRDDRWGRSDRRNDPWDDRWGRRDDPWYNDRYDRNDPWYNDRYDRNDPWNNRYDPYNDPWYREANTRRVRVESDGGRRKIVRVANRGVRLARQISYARCIQGRTWDYNNSAIWVTDGCRAEFIVAIR